MTPDKKKRLIDAYNAYLERSPTADKPYEDIVDTDGSPMTPRKSLQKGIANGAIFRNVENYLQKHPEMTFGQFVDALGRMQPRPSRARHWKI
ncbi:MAG: hypothetical protein KGQ70_04075 [Alphaproteobacteria bacterium]|nr:hypothetical protein [Alphaproteobacteria bacterium]